jgi:hypothetical protein
VRTTISSDIPVPKPFQRITKKATMHTSVTRLVRAADLRDAHTMHVVFGESDPEVFAGSTADGPSLAVMDELRRNGAAAIRIHTMRRRLGFYPQEYEVVGTVRRVESGPVPYRVLVNGAPALVAAIHVRGRFGVGRDAADYEAWYLDHPRMPVALKTASGWNNASVVSFAWTSDTTLHAVERSLMKDRHALVYGIYFSFASDSIRAESEPVLREIADAMKRHPDWRIRLEGHTDSIGNAGDNLALSQRRVDAVKRALVGRYGVAQSRLTTQGFGKSRPLDTNATPEGRARNRRVELTLQ